MLSKVQMNILLNNYNKYLLQKILIVSDQYTDQFLIYAGGINNSIKGT